MIKLQHFLCIPLLLFVTMLSAQTRVIKGKVISSQDQTAIPGATVSVKGSQQATTTGADGVFSLSVPKCSLLILARTESDKYTIKTRNVRHRLK